MKRFVLIFLIAVVVSACKKTNVTPGLYGKWELRHRMGSIAGFDSTYAAGNGRILQYKPDSTYLQYNKGQLVTQGKFHIGIIDFPSANSPAISFDDSSAK